MKVKIQSVLNENKRFEYEIFDAFAEDGELIVIGFNHDLTKYNKRVIPKDPLAIVKPEEEVYEEKFLHNRLECFGLKFHKDFAYFYRIKYQTQKKYKEAMALAIGDSVELKSNILSGIWQPEVFKKVDVNGVKKLLSFYDYYEEALKAPDGIMLSDGDEMVNFGDEEIKVKRWNKLDEN